MDRSRPKQLPALPSSFAPGKGLRRRSLQVKHVSFADEEGIESPVLRQDGPQRDEAALHALKSSAATPSSSSHVSGVSRLSSLLNPFSPRHDLFVPEASLPQHVPSVDEPVYLSDLAHIPLTPLPGAYASPPALAKQSSWIPRLPTPDFGRVSRTLHDVVDRVTAWQTTATVERPQSLHAERPASRPTSVALSDMSSARQTIAPTVVSEVFSSPPPEPEEDFRDVAHRSRLALPSRAPNVARHLAHKFPLPRATPGDDYGGMLWGVQGMGLWTLSKWIMLLSVVTVFTYGIVGFTLTLLTWYQAFERADVFYVTNFDIIVFLLVATLLVLLTSIIGMTGTLLNSRPILAFYAMLLFPAFVSLLIPAYTAYKRANLSLDRKLNLAWSQWWTDQTRLIVQNSLHCCGYYTPLHQAVYSSKCYPRVPLRGCKSALLAYESQALRKVYTTLFALVPVHIVNMLTALLCANHVTSTLGKGLTPKHYRLTAADVRENSELVLAFLAEQRRAEEHLQRASLAKPPGLQVHAIERDDSRPRSWNSMGWGRRSMGNGSRIARDGAVRGAGSSAAGIGLGYDRI